MSQARRSPGPQAGRVDLDRGRAAGDRDADPAQDLDQRADVVAGRVLEGEPAAGDGRRDEERARSRCGPGITLWSAPRRRRVPWTSIVSGAVRCDVGAHLAQEGDQVVDLRLLGGRADDRVAVGEGGGEHRVLGAHDGDLREGDLAAAEPARRLGVVVAVAVLDLGAQGPHRVHVQVDRAAGRSGRRPGC